MSHRAISGLYDIALKEKPMVIMDILCWPLGTIDTIYFSRINRAIAIVLAE